MVTVEIEKKYLIANKEELFNFIRTAANVEKQIIEQQYITITPEEEVRVRRKTKNDTSSYLMTTKKGHGLKREENEISIPLSTYELHMNSIKAIPISKIRYSIPYGEFVLEIDMYQNKSLKDLIVVEVEAKNEEDLLSLEIPSFVGKDITELKVYKNQSLWKIINNLH